MSFRGGKFSTGTTGNFQPELTGEANRNVMAQTWPPRNRP